MRETNMREPKRIKLNLETPTTKEPTKYRLLPINRTELEVTGQDNDDKYTPLVFDKRNYEDNSKNN
jgi:hypothetical protein